MTSFDKAIVGALVSGALSALALVDVTGEMTVEQALTSIITALVTGAAVYIKRNVQ